MLTTIQVILNKLKIIAHRVIREFDIEIISQINQRRFDANLYRQLINFKNHPSFHRAWDPINNEMTTFDHLLKLCADQNNDQFTLYIKDTIKNVIHGKTPEDFRSVKWQSLALNCPKEIIEALCENTSFKNELMQHIWEKRT